MKCKLRAVLLQTIVLGGYLGYLFRILSGFFYIFPQKLINELFPWIPSESAPWILLGITFGSLQQISFESYFRTSLMAKDEPASGCKSLL